MTNNYIIIGNVPHCEFLDPLVAIIGSFVIVSWAIQLMHDTSMNLLDIIPDSKFITRLKKVLENDGTQVVDLHVWRLGPGHLGAIVSVIPPPHNSYLLTNWEKKARLFYVNKLKRFKAISHLTVEICEDLEEE